ncbi:S-layer homology domain-containing protein [Brevibacillus brevis]|nr:S-layer homology domain-containing protein [Brevibacillus brevis]
MVFDKIFRTPLKNNPWAADAIRRANEAGLMNDFSNGTFNPGGGITQGNGDHRIQISGIKWRRHAEQLLRCASRSLGNSDYCGSK